MHPRWCQHTHLKFVKLFKSAKKWISPRYAYIIVSNCGCHMWLWFLQVIIVCCIIFVLLYVLVWSVSVYEVWTACGICPLSTSIGFCNGLICTVRITPPFSNSNLSKTCVVSRETYRPVLPGMVNIHASFSCSEITLYLRPEKLH